MSIISIKEFVGKLILNTGITIYFSYSLFERNKAASACAEAAFFFTLRFCPVFDQFQFLSELCFFLLNKPNTAQTAASADIVITAAYP